WSRTTPKRRWSRPSCWSTGTTASRSSTWLTTCPRAASSLSRWFAIPSGNMSRRRGWARKSVEQEKRGTWSPWAANSAQLRFRRSVSTRPLRGVPVLADVRLRTGEHVARVGERGLVGTHVGEHGHEVVDDPVVVRRGDAEPAVGLAQLAPVVPRGPAEHLGQQQDLVPLEAGHVDVGEVVGELRVAEDPVVEAVDRLTDGGRPAEPLVVARGRGDAVGPIPSHGALLRTREPVDFVAERSDYAP